MTPPVVCDLLARTLYGEARGEGVAGMQAVAAVILTRAANPRWWGHDVAGVILAPWQFSCWLEEPTGEKHVLDLLTTANAFFRQAQGVAAQAMAGLLIDPTHGADSYANLATCSPAWARNRAACAVIGHHHFYRLEVPAPAGPAGRMAMPRPSGQPALGGVA